MSAFSMGLMGGLGDTLSFLGQRYLNDKDEKEKQAREDAKMAQQAQYQQQLEILKEKAAQAHSEFEESIRGPKYETYETTNDKGQNVKRTVRSSYDPTQKKRIEEPLGEAIMPLPAPATRNVINGDMESTQQFDPKTGQWSTIGAPGQRWKPETAGTRDQDAINAREDAREEGKNRRAAMALTKSQLKDFDRLSSNYDKEDFYKQRGIDPKAPNARAQLEDQILTQNLAGFGLESAVPKSSDGGGLMGAGKKSTAGKPGSSPDNPAPAESFTSDPPPGTWVRTPQGRVFQIPGA